MRALVCGSGGFIGGALVRELDCEGHDVWCTGNKIECDLTKTTACNFVVQWAQPEVVYICAGVTGGSGIINKDPLMLVTPNLLIHSNMFEACRRYGVKKVVCLSSTTGYPDTDLPMQEEDYFAGELHPSYFNPGHTRRFIERLGAMYPELSVVFLRPSVVYGPGDDFDLETCHVIPALVRKVAERHDPITVWGDGSNWRDGVYIDDVVRALRLASAAPAGAYNLASGEGMTVAEILGHLQGAFKHHPKIEYDTSKPSMLKKRVLAIDKAKHVLSWEPRIRMHEGLSMTLAWYASR